MAWVWEAEHDRFQVLWVNCILTLFKLDTYNPHVVGLIMHGSCSLRMTIRISHLDTIVNECGQLAVSVKISAVPSLCYMHAVIKGITYYFTIPRYSRLRWHRKSNWEKYS